MDNRADAILGGMITGSVAVGSVCLLTGVIAGEPGLTIMGAIMYALAGALFALAMLTDG